MIILLLLVAHMTHVSHGAHGIVMWVQPPHIAAGIGWVRGHFITWWQWQN